MATIPHRLRIKHLDMASGTLLDVTRAYGAYVRTFLIDQKQQYDESPLSEECQAQWVQLLKETYESAWFVLLVGSSAIAVVIFAMSFFRFSRSRSWRWFSKSVGAITFVATTGAAIYSLGEVSWHVFWFSDFWSAFQVVTGYRFNPVIMELLSTLFSAYAGWILLTS